MAAILKNFKRDTLYLCNRLTDFNEIDRMVIHISLPNTVGSRKENFENLRWRTVES